MHIVYTVKMDFNKQDHLTFPQIAAQLGCSRQSIDNLALFFETMNIKLIWHQNRRYVSKADAKKIPKTDYERKRLIQGILHPDHIDVDQASECLEMTPRQVRYRADKEGWQTIKPFKAILYLKEDICRLRRARNGNNKKLGKTAAKLKRN